MATKIHPKAIETADEALNYIRKVLNGEVNVETIDEYNKMFSAYSKLRNFVRLVERVNNAE